MKSVLFSFFAYLYVGELEIGYCVLKWRMREYHSIYILLVLMWFAEITVCVIFSFADVSLNVLAPEHLWADVEAHEKAENVERK